MFTGEKAYMDAATIFPQGYESEDYQVYILVRVSDFIGSYSDLEISAQVKMDRISAT